MVLHTKDILINQSHSIFSKNYRIQIFAAFTVQILCFSHGIGIGWLSPTLKALQSTESPLDFIVNVTEASWIGSLYGLGSIFGAASFGILLDLLGRKICLLVIAVPHTILWILIYVAVSVEFLYVGRFTAGLTAGGLFVVLPLYIGEISDPSIRGALSSLAMVFVSLGILVGFILASYIDYHLLPCVIIVLPIIYLITASILHDTPQHLLRKGKLEAAEKAYKFYKNIGKEYKCTSEIQPKSCEGFEALKEIILKGEQSEKFTLKDFINSAALKAFFIAFMLIALVQLSGSFAFVNYMSDIFALSGATMDPNTCTIIMGVVQVVGSCCASIVVDRVGRRSLLLTSSVGMTLGLIGFGLFTLIVDPVEMDQLNWVMILLMAFTVLTFSAGMAPLIFVIIVEVMPAKIRSIGLSLAMLDFSIMVFVALKLIPLSMHGFGISTTMFICAGICVVTSTFLAIFFKETKGKSMDKD